MSNRLRPHASHMFFQTNSALSHDLGERRRYDLIVNSRAAGQHRVPDQTASVIR
ncbi:hypothetical protein [Burkholderia sp. SCN-KJ]|uniref:hypothetical protein n=1 Tax=Burkholderia sp. SCN-KJ TaxID=2969248 RepID=UPI00214FB031|nr:hypothetical protein [Burkholderia sp. SCN-KJ]MCR4468339.1 hypothetical protein [Burkholderia sp. SCN-KJ]